MQRATHHLARSRAAWTGPRGPAPIRRFDAGNKPTADDTIVQFENVEFRYPGGSHVLQHLNLSLSQGQVVALVGRSGVGKSTLLKLINRLLVPTSGRVLVEGRDTREWDAIRLRRRIGYVFQHAGLLPHMSVARNIAIVPRLERWPEARARARALELLETVGLAPADYADRSPDELSGGQRQRVGLARALAADPPILLMDEPFGALDWLTRAEVRGEFQRLQQRLHKTIVIVTHDLAEAFAVAQRVGVLHQGELIVCDTPGRVAASADPRIRALVDAAPPPPPRGGE